MKNIFGRRVETGIALFESDGSVVTRLDENVYPVGSEFSGRYEHPQGIVISVEDATRLQIQIEGQ